MGVSQVVRRQWDQHPLSLILLGAGFFRLLAVLFSKGYGMHDDHFLVIEAAQSWVDGRDYNYWIPSLSPQVTEPTGHSLLYPGLHYFLFRLLEGVGMFDPQAKMYVVRLLHALLSMTIVVMGYRLADRLQGKGAAKIAGLLLGMLFFMPMMSVRNLAEFVCIPALLYASVIAVREEHDQRWKPLLLAGLLLGLACSVRFQTIVFSGGMGLALLILRRWRQAFALGAGFVGSLVLVQMVTDMIIWGTPFMELMAYIRYNIDNAETYGVQRWYNYILLLSGILIPPVSLFLLFGYLRSWRKHLLLFLPAFAFLLFHSSFPNKQERFILPAIPFVIILGSIGWSAFHAGSKFWMRNTRLYRGIWIFFWSVNLAPLLFVSTTYSHRSRVEAMVYLSRKADFRELIVEETNHDYTTQPPLFYLRHWTSPLELHSGITMDTLKARMAARIPAHRPNYVVFNQEDDIDARVAAFKREFPGLTYETTIYPSFVDEVMHWLNHHNANFSAYVYRIE